MAVGWVYANMFISWNFQVVKNRRLDGPGHSKGLVLLVCYGKWELIWGLHVHDPQYSMYIEQLLNVCGNLAWDRKGCGIPCPPPWNPCPPPWKKLADHGNQKKPKKTKKTNQDHGNQTRTMETTMETKPGPWKPKKTKKKPKKTKP
jgi:hypothetical protein